MMTDFQKRHPLLRLGRRRRATAQDVPDTAGRRGPLPTGWPVTG